MILDITLQIADKFVVVCAGFLWLTGLLTGVWKYWQISKSKQAQAHVYVDIAHRSALMFY